MIERELAEHDPRLAGLPRMLALSKADLVPPRRPSRGGAARRRGASAMGQEVPVLVTSSATGEGLDELARELLRRVPVAEPRAGGGRRGRGGRVPRVPPGGAARVRGERVGEARSASAARASSA